MSRQDKATTDRHARTLRELVRRPENKVCADCKKNDPRWASWNLGVFLCIRCSGIHRSMGTHISKVKSVDLDIWTPEQMESITKWGNRLANLYWEAHLKAGHVPPDHKIESFIRSKYESRRWALEGPPPSDPSTLLGGLEAPQEQTPASAPAPPSRPSTSTPPVTRQPQAHQLLSANYRNTNTSIAPPSAVPAQAQAPAQVPQQPTQPVNDLFSLDFHAPPVQQPAQEQPKKGVKSDIMSLFAAAPPTIPAMNNSALWGGPVQQQQQVYQQQQQQQPAQPVSMMGTNGTGMWGVSSGWQGAPVPPAQANVWGAPAASAQPPTVPTSSLFDTTSVWGNPAAPVASPDPFGAFASSTTASNSTQQKKDDAFGDIWGGFK